MPDCRLTLLALLLLSAACGGAPAETRQSAPLEPTPDGPERFGHGMGQGMSELEGRFAELMREPLLAPLPAEGGVTKALMTYRVARIQELNDEYKTAAARPELKELATFRLAQLGMLMGCEVAATGSPGEVTTEQEGKIGEILSGQAAGVLDAARQTLNRHVVWSPQLEEAAYALQGLPLNPAGEPAAVVVEVKALCEQTEPYWRNPAPTGWDEFAAPRCEEGAAAFCWVWGTAGTGGAAAMEKACKLGVESACK